VLAKLLREIERPRGDICRESLALDIGRNPQHAILAIIVGFDRVGQASVDRCRCRVRCQAIGAARQHLLPRLACPRIAIEGISCVESRVDEHADVGPA